MTEPNPTIEGLHALFVDTFHVEVPSSDIDLLETGILDSFQFVELLVQIENRFGVNVGIDDIDLDDLRTLAGIARLIAASAADGRWTAPGAPADASA